MLYEAIQIYCNWIMLWRGWRWTLGSLYSHISLSSVVTCNFRETIDNC
jgi:hypothetical protein